MQLVQADELTKQVLGKVIRIDGVGTLEGEVTSVMFRDDSIMLEVKVANPHAVAVITIADNTPVQIFDHVADDAEE